MVGSVAAARGEGAVRKGPYIQNLTRNSVTVMVETRPERSCSVLVRDARGQQLQRVTDRPSVMHEIVLGDLESGHRYSYSVQCEGADVGGGEFATAPDSDSPFMFVVFGDSRSMPGAHSSVIERIRAEVPDFLLGTGDLVNEGGIESDWQTFFEI